MTGIGNIFGVDTGGFASGNFEALTAKSLQRGLGKVMENYFKGSRFEFIENNITGNVSTFAARAMISGEPTGDWHLTIGNPLNPIATIGNLYCEQMVVKFGDILGADDFPNEISFELTLKHAQKRDKASIESFMNAGRGRSYQTVEKLEDLLGNKRYYGNISPNIGTTSDLINGGDNPESTANKTNILNPSSSSIGNVSASAKSFADNNPLIETIIKFVES